MFNNRKFVGKQEAERVKNSLWGKYLLRAKNNSLLYFGVPCFGIMYLALHLMTQFNSIRYEQHDKRATEVSQEDALKKHGNKRKVNVQEEFYRLQHLDVDNWEQKRVQRLPGESDNKW